MQYTTLGHSGIQVSKICLGCMGFGKPSADFLTWTEADPKICQQVIEHAWDLGINYFDTANVYTNGDSERYLGQAIKNLSLDREKVVIQTKVFFNDGKLSKQAIEREIDGSLKRLNMDYVDIYMIHRFDYHHPMEETMQTLHSLIEKGKVRALGASAMYGYQFHNLQNIAEQNHWTKFTVMQNHYNLIYREDERDLIPVCRQFNTAIAPYSPLAGGHLAHIEWSGYSHRSQQDKVLPAKYDAFKEPDLLIIQRVSEIAQKRQISMAQVALSWAYAKGVDSPVLGSISTAHLDDAIKALDIVLTAEEIAYLEELYVPHKVVGAILSGQPERIERK